MTIGKIHSIHRAVWYNEDERYGLCYPENTARDVEACVRTVVDEECGTLEEHRELGLRILARLGISPVGPKL